MLLLQNGTEGRHFIKANTSEGLGRSPLHHVKANSNGPLTPVGCSMADSLCTSITINLYDIVYCVYEFKQMSAVV